MQWRSSSPLGQSTPKTKMKPNKTFIIRHKLQCLKVEHNQDVTQCKNVRLKQKINLITADAIANQVAVDAHLAVRTNVLPRSAPLCKQDETETSTSASIRR